MKHLFEECISYLTPSIIEKKIDVTCEVPSIEIKTDRRLLKQILLNLMSNAIKFNHAGGFLRLAISKNNVSTIEFTIQDSGIGMTDTEVAKVREPFALVESAYSRKIEGTGLGLTLVEKFVEILGGGVEISSIKGTGTTIQIILPITHNS